MSPASRFTRKLSGRRWRACEGLADVLEFVNERFDERALAQEQLVAEAEQTVAPVLAQLGEELPALGDEQLLGQLLGEVAPIPEELAKEPPNQTWDGAPVIHVAGREAEGQELAAVARDQVELAALNPTARDLAPCRVGGEDAMLADARVLADGQRRRVDEADASAGTELRVQIADERHQHGRQQLARCGCS